MKYLKKKSILLLYLNKLSFQNINVRFRLLKTTEGEITVDGKEEYMDLISYVPQFTAIYPALTVAESLDISLRYQGHGKDFRKNKVE